MKKTTIMKMVPWMVFNTVSRPITGTITNVIAITAMNKINKWIDGDPQTVEKVSNKYRDLVEKYDTAHTDEEKAEAYMGLEALRQALGGKTVTSVEGQQILNNTECEVTPIEGDDEPKEDSGE